MYRFPALARRARQTRTFPSLSAKRSAEFGPAQILALTPAAWFRWNVGVTVTGSGVSQWDDQSGNARHLKQATDTNRPALQADGSILFDGVDNLLRCDPFTLNQPETVYILFKQVTWTVADRIYDGNTTTVMALFQTGSTPQIQMFAGSAVGTISPTLNVYTVVASVFNGAASVNQVGASSSAAVDAGASNAAGFTLGAQPAGNYGNIEVREVIIFPVAHSAAVRLKVARYLARLGGVSF